MKVRTGFGMILMLLAVGAYGDGTASSRLHAARSLKCHFGAGTSTQWTGSAPKAEAASMDQDVHFDAIDLRAHSARLIGNIGANDISVFESAAGLTFLEMKPFLTDTTTVFAVYGANDEFLAVDTRHVVISGRALAEQYYGLCRVWQ